MVLHKLPLLEQQADYISTEHIVEVPSQYVPNEVQDEGLDILPAASLALMTIALGTVALKRVLKPVVRWELERKR